MMQYSVEVVSGVGSYNGHVDHLCTSLVEHLRGIMANTVQCSIKQNGCKVGN